MVASSEEGEENSKGEMNQGSGNSGAVSSPVAVPGTTNSKKSHNKSHGKNQGSSGGGGSGGGGGGGGGIPFKTIEVAPAPRRKKRKAPEMETPLKVAALLPESAIYSQLVELEAKVDAVLARKKMEIQDWMKEPVHCQKTLRIYVFNTYANQPQENTECKSGEAPSWTLKIIGKVLEDGAGSNLNNVAEKNISEPKLSFFFKKIVIYLDKNLYPDNHVILWDHSRSRVLHEGFEVKRKGDKEFTAIIRLEMNYIFERCKLSACLSQVLGLEIETRSKVMIALWQYLKLKKLQDPNDPSYFICDAPLRKVFQEDKIKFAAAAQKLVQHLSPVQPIQLEHRIKLSGNNPSGDMCYDVPVDVPFPLEKDMSAFLEKTEKCKEIDDHDNAITSAIKKINEHRRRRAFFLGFSQSPAEFINTVIGSQDRDLKVVAGDAIQNAEKERRSDFYNQPWVDDAAVHYLNRKAGSRVDAAGTT